MDLSWAVVLSIMSFGLFSRTELTISEIPNTVGLNGVDGPGFSCRTSDEGTFGRFTGQASVGSSAAFTRALFTTARYFCETELYQAPSAR